MNKLPQYSAKDLKRALAKLGFTYCGGGRHQHKYKHNTLRSSAKRPYLVFPDNLEKKPQFQKAILRDLNRYWGIPLEDILKALK